MTFLRSVGSRDALTLPGCPGNAAGFRQAPPPPRPLQFSLPLCSAWLPLDPQEVLGYEKTSREREDTQTEQWTLASLAGRGDRQGGEAKARGKVLGLE